MKDGYIKTAAITPDTKVADTIYNTEQICKKNNRMQCKWRKDFGFPGALYYRLQLRGFVFAGFAFG